MDCKFIPIPCYQSPSLSLENRSVLGLYRLNESRDYIDDGFPFSKVCDTSYWKSYDFTMEPLNLNQGEVVLKNANRFTEEGIHPILEWLHRHPPSTKPDFVSSQGNFMMLMCTPFEKRVPWSYSFVEYNGTIYIKSNDTPFYIEERENMPFYRLQARKWAEKFKDILSRPPNSDYTNFFNSKNSCEGIFSSSLDGIKLIYGAEVKAIRDSINEPLKCEDLIDCKINKILTNRKFLDFSKTKLIKWWCLNYLTGVPETLCGFRDDEIRSFKTTNMPKMRGVNWKPNVCLEFLRNLLHYLKGELINDPNVVHNVSWDPPGTTIKIARSERDISYVVEDKYRV